LTPQFITFTGVDERTDVAAMKALSAKYPIEWGILFSPRRQGVQNRYPDRRAIERFLDQGLRLSAHLCGLTAREVSAGQYRIALDLAYFDLPTYFHRVQINHTTPKVPNIAEFSRILRGRRCIIQVRATSFPPYTGVDMLFDRSGGRGQAPEAWPPHPGHLVGYAGGLGANEVLRNLLQQIPEGGVFWIDMENRVRTHDWFDLSLCEEVCRMVYGERG
jgi:hypothetical protein